MYLLLYKRLRYFIQSFCLVMMINTAEAQLIDLEWVKTIGGPFADDVARPAVYANGDILVSGSFRTNCNFGSGTSSLPLTSSGSQDIFVARYNPAGSIVWLKKMGGSSGSGGGSATSTDAAGNAYISGKFSGTVDFDPGPAVSALTSVGNFDMYVVKLDAAGNFVWVKQMGSTGTQTINPSDIEADPAGNLYITGTVWGQNIDVDPGPGVYPMSSPVGIQNGYILKLDAAGNFQWAFQFQSPHLAAGVCLALDQDNNIITTGYLSGSFDFDPGPATFIMTSTDPDPRSGDMFILKLGPAGNFIWAKQIGGIGGETPFEIETDLAGHIYTVGSFSAGNSTSGTDFDPGPGVRNLFTQPTFTSIFISKLSPAGDYVWAKQIKGYSSGFGFMSGAGIAVEDDQHVIVSGYFFNTADADPGPGRNDITSVGNTDHFLAVLQPDGSFVSVETMGGPDQENASHLLKGTEGSIYFIGDYHPAAGFKPCYGTPVNNAGTIDIFVAKYVRPDIRITASTASICTGSSVTFTATVKNEGNAPTIRWLVNGVNAGTNSNTFTSASLLNNDVVSAVLIRATNCPVPATDTSNKIIMQVGTAVVPTVVIATPYLNSCTGMPVSFTATITNGGNDPQYQWMVNGNITGPDEPVFTTSSLLNNDQVTVRLLSDAGCATPPVVVSNSIRMQVSDPPLPIVTISYPTGPVCSGLPVQFKASVQNEGPGTSYQWTLNGAPAGSNSSTYTLQNPVQNDVVRCIITTIRSCSPVPVQIASNEITLVVYPSPVLAVTPASATLLISRSIQLTASITGNYTNFTWQPAATLSSNNILNPVATPLITTDYILKVSTADGCLLEAKASIKVVQRLFMPNSFTPNNDGRNDLFRIPPTSDINLEYLRVYNRLGNLVFQTRNANTGWDGTQKGMPASEGNYVYMLKGFDHEGKEVMQQGNILLLR